jgi:WD40 repeat protein
LRVWDVAAGRELGRVLIQEEFHSLGLSADEQFALGGLHNGDVVYIDLDARRVVKRLKGHTAAVDWVAFSPEQGRVFSGSTDGTARLWNLSDGKELARFRVEGKKWVRGGAALPDGRRLLTGDSEGLLQVWDVATGQEVKRVPLGGAWMIHSLGLAAGGKHALVACVAGLRVIDLETGKELRHFQAEHEDVYHAALSPDGRLLLAAGFDGAIRLWDYQAGALIREMGRHDGYGFSVAFSPDGRRAASGGGGFCRDGGDCEPGKDHDIRLWELTAQATTTPAARAPLWLAAAGIVLLVITLSIGGVWWAARRRGSQPPAPAAEVKPANVAPGIPVRCGGCGRNLRAKAEAAGKTLKCPQCGQAVTVPGIQAAAGGRP